MPDFLSSLRANASNFLNGSANTQEVRDANARIRQGEDYRNAARRFSGIDVPTPEIGADPVGDAFSRGRAADLFSADRQESRSVLNMARDTTLDVAGGFAGGAISVAALAGSGVAAYQRALGNNVYDVGVPIAQFGESTTSFLSGLRTTDARDAGDAYATSADVLSEQNRQAEQAALAAGQNPLLAGAGRIAADAFDTGGNLLDQPRQVASGISQGVGSLLLGGPLSKGVTAGARFVAPGIEALSARGLLSSGAARAVVESIENAAMTGSIAAMEAGGAYTQASNQVMGMSHADLMENSPQYAALIAAGRSPDNAKNIIASRAGSVAASLQAPIAAATGSLVSRFEAAPLAGTTIRGALQNIGKETIEEGVQSFSGALNSNIGVRLTGNENQDLSAGVGQGLAEGAVFGAGTAGVFAGPSIAVGGVERTVQAGRDILARGRATNNRDAVDVSSTTAEAVRAAVEPVDMTPVQNPEIDPVADQAEIDAYTEEAVYAGQQFHFDRENFTPQNEIENLVVSQLDPTNENPDIWDVMELAANKIKQSSTSPEEKVQLAVMIDGLRQQATGNRTMELIQKVQNEATPGGTIAREFGKVIKAYEAISNNKIVEDALKAGTSATPDVKLADVEDISTPEGLQAARKAGIQATLTPENIAPEVAERLLKHSDDTPGIFSPKQIASLRSIPALSKANKAALITAEKTGAKAPDTARVSAEIQSVNYDQSGVAGPSVKGHYALVNDPASLGLNEEAKAAFEDFRAFAQHMANKLTAVNESFTGREFGDKQRASDGDNPTVEFQAYSNANKEWFKSSWAVARFDAKKSIPDSQQIGVDAEYVIDAFNALVDQYPDMAMKKVDEVRLDPGLQKSPKDVVRAASAAQKAGAVTKAVTPPVSDVSLVETAPEQKQQKQPEPQNEPEPALTAERVAKAQDAGIIRQIELIEDRRDFGTPLTNDAANLKVLKAERDKREAALVEEPSVVVEDTATPTPAPVKAVEAVAEPEAKPEVKATEETARAEVKPPVSMDQAFPGLVKSTAGENLFVDGFVFDKEARSRLVGENALTAASVAAALNSPEGFASLTGLAASKIAPAVSQAYNQTIRAVAGPVFSKITERLSKSKDFARHMKGQEIGSKGEKLGINLVGLRLINLMERQSDGSLDFSGQVKTIGVLALSDWLAQNSVATPNRDAEEIAKALGIDTALVDEELAAQFNGGIVSTRATLGLLQKLEQYFGISPEENTPLGQSRGVLLSLAGELLVAAREAGVINSVINSDTGETFNFLTVNKDKLGLVKEGEGASFMGQTTLIEQIVLQDETVSGYSIGKPSGKTTPRLQGGGAPTTEEQRATQVRENAVGHSPNMPVLEVYRRLGAEQTIALHANGELAETMNKNDRLAKTSQNLSVLAAYDTVMGVVQEMEGYVEGSKQLADIMLHYEYQFSSVNRMQQQGSYGSQSSKLTREIITPYGNTLDLSDRTSEDYSMWRRGLAQALGVKVELQTDDVWEPNLQKVLANPKTAAAIELLKDFNNVEPAALVAALKAAKIETSVGLHAAISVAEYEKTEDKSKFTTHMYVEADGKTDGPTNSIVYMRLGGFDENMVTALARGGIEFSERPVPLPEYYSENDQGDAYQVSAKRTGLEMANHLQSVLNKAQDETARAALATQAEAVNVVLQTLIGDPKNFSYTNDGRKSTFVIGRNQLKNPMTVTVYGSSANGIATKIAKELTGKLYEQISEANRLATAAGVPDQWQGFMFYDAEAGALNPELMGNFFNALGTLTTKRVGKSNADAYYVSNIQGGGIPGVKSSAVNYTVSPTATKALADAIQTFYVTPMREAINAEMGTSVAGSELIQKSTNMLSSVAKAAFNRLMAIELEKTKLSDGLTPKQLKAILAKVSFLFPYMEGDVITVNVKGLEAGTPTIPHAVTGKPQKAKSGASLSNELTAQLEVPMPAVAGVAGAAYVNISYGDGRMIINASPGLTGGRLHIFDGINVAIKDARKNGVAINKAVIDSIQTGTPFKDLMSTYKELTESLNLSIFTENEMVAIHKDTLGSKIDPEVTATELVKDQINYLSVELLRAQQQEQARQAVFARVHISSDHMAALNAPASTAGDQREDLSSLSLKDKAKRLNDMYKEELAKIEKRDSASDTTSSSLDKAMNGLPTHKTGAKFIGSKRLREVIDTLNIPAAQRLLINRALQALGSDNWSVVLGNREQANAYAQDQGIDHTFGAKDYGLTAPARKTIIVANGSSETLAHELIHAATIDRVEAYFSNPDDLDPESRAAIGRLEALQGEWMTSVDEAVTYRQEGAREAVQAAKTAISRMLDKADRAGALNEFMAWNLANQELMKLNSTIKVESKLARIAKDVVSALRKLFRLPVSAGNDMASNIRFNTLILMSEDLPSIRRQTSDRLLEQSFKVRPDLQNIWQKFGELVANVDKVTGFNNATGYKPSELAFQKAEDALAIVKNHGFNLSSDEGRAFVMVVAAYRLNAVKDAAANTKLGAYVRELTAQMNQTNMAVGDPQDPAENAAARDRISLLDGTTDVGSDVNGLSLLVPVVLALGAVSEQAQGLFSRIEVRDRKLAAKGTTLDTALKSRGSNLVDTMMDRSYGIKANQKVGQELQNIAASLIKQTAIERALNSEVLNTVPNFVRDMNEKTTQVMSYGLGKGVDALDYVMKLSEGTPVETSAKNVGKVAQLGLKLMDKRMTEEAVSQLTSLLNDIDMPQELVALWSEILGMNETNQDVLILAKQGRALIDRIRQAYRKQMPQQIRQKFTRELTQEEWSHLHHLGQKDMSVLLGQGMTIEALIALVGDKAAVASLMGKKEADIRRLFGAVAPTILTEAGDLAALMNEGIPANGTVKRNALAIANRVGTAKVGTFDLNSDETKAIDGYVSLLALSQTDPTVLASLENLSKTEAKGMSYTLALISQARQAEMERVPDRLKYNVQKGYMPSEQLGSFKAVPRDKLNDYTKAGYKQVGVRTAGPSETLQNGKGKELVYVATDIGSPAFKQGIMRTVRSTVFGLDAITGASFDNPTGGLITDPATVTRLTQSLRAKKATDRSLAPLFDKDGNLYAYERLIDPSVVSNALQTQQNAAVSLGQWMGRQHEEIHAASLNDVLIGRLAKMYEDASRTSQTDDFVDLAELAKTDPVVADAMRLITDRDMSKVFAKMGGKFMVRKDLYEQIIGYRTISVTDLWTGNTRIVQKNREAVTDFLTGLMGPEAYRRLAVSEQVWENLMGDARVAIVVKSMLVPALNAMANFYQLMANGIGPIQIATKAAEKLRETHLYAQNHLEHQRLEIELARAKGEQRPDHVRRIETEMRRIEDANKRLTIWPLVEAGEFSQVTEGLTQDDLEMTKGRFWDHLSKLAEKLPKSVQTAGRYAVVAKDTALFEGLARTVAYTDFVAKAVLYDHLSTKEKLDKRAALLRITNEFVNYDLLGGRMKSKAEAMGLIWFPAFKIRSIKVAASLIRNNPLHSFLSSMVPGSMDVGTPVDDNAISLALDNRLMGMFGIDNAWRGITLNPWLAMFK